MAAKLIASMDFEHKCDWDNDCDCDSDCDSDCEELTMDEQLAKFLAANPKLANVECICVNTGYTHRIIENEELLDDIVPAVVFTDKCWNADLKPYINDQVLHDLVINIKGIDDGTCVFDSKDADNVFSCIDDLHNAEYCGFCNTDNLYHAEWYEIDGKIVMVAKVDCESG